TPPPMNWRPGCGLAAVRGDRGHSGRSLGRDESWFAAMRGSRGGGCCAERRVFALAPPRRHRHTPALQPDPPSPEWLLCRLAANRLLHLVQRAPGSDHPDDESLVSGDRTPFEVLYDAAAELRGQLEAAGITEPMASLSRRFGLSEA